MQCNASASYFNSWKPHLRATVPNKRDILFSITFLDLSAFS